MKLTTIAIGEYIMVQGDFVKSRTNGNVVVRVGEKTFEGRPVGKAA